MGSKKLGMDLCTHIDNISDDFSSTFVQVNEDTLQNMMGHSGDIDIERIELENIINKYIPGTKIKLTKMGWFGEVHDSYLIRVYYEKVLLRRFYKEF